MSEVIGNPREDSRRERRKQIRFQLNQLIRFHLGRETFLSAECTDISVGGFGFFTDKPVAVGTRLYFLFELAMDKENCTIQGEGIVMWCTEEVDSRYRAGLKFTDLDDNSKETCMKYLEEQ